MSKKHKPAAPEQTGKKSSGNRWAIALTVVLVIALIAVLTYQPSNRSTSMPQQSSTPQHGAFDFVKQGELRFLSPKQEFLSALDIQFARDESQRELGLMYRDTLAENQGMLFLFDEEAIRSFWMKNTVLPLDMIFVNAQREIVTIHKNTTPYSEQTYESTKPAQYVLEVNAGYTDRHKISVGDRIAWNQL